jgi:hypothetical protein
VNEQATSSEREGFCRGVEGWRRGRDAPVKGAPATEEASSAMSGSGSLETQLLAASLTSPVDEADERTCWDEMGWDEMGSPADEADERTCWDEMGWDEMG